MPHPEVITIKLSCSIPRSKCVVRIFDALTLVFLASISSIYLKRSFPTSRNDLVVVATRSTTTISTFCCSSTSKAGFMSTDTPVTANCFYFKLLINGTLLYTWETFTNKIFFALQKIFEKLLDIWDSLLLFPAKLQRGFC